MTETSTRLHNAPDWLRRGIAATLAGSLLLTLPLWLTKRDYPLTPVIDALRHIPSPFDYILLGVMFLALAGVVLLRNPRWPIVAVCCIALLWVAIDQSRLHPYLFHSVALLASLLPIAWEQRESWNPDYLHWSLAPGMVLLVFTYLYSGLEKLNYEFVHWVFPDVIAPVAGWIGVSVDDIPETLLIVAGLTAALFEAAGGVLLIFLRTRRVAAICLTIMHLFIILAVGPTGSDSNRAILAWNVGMIIAIWSLFGTATTDSSSPPFFSRAWWMQALRIRSDPSGYPHLAQALTIAGITILFGIMPILGFAGWWDSYPSFALYSGNTLNALIWVDPADHSRLPVVAQQALREDGTLDLNKWSLAETGATFYPEPRIVLNIGKTITERWAQHDAIAWMASTPNTFTGERTVRNWRCPAGGDDPVEVKEMLFNATGQ
jgi:uncharacterized membrane protein YphA (DoxX/SURF4 family)